MSVTTKIERIAKTATVPMRQIARIEMRHKIRQINKMLSDVNKWRALWRAECDDLPSGAESAMQAGSAERLVNTIAGDLPRK